MRVAGLRAAKGFRVLDAGILLNALDDPGGTPLLLPRC